MNKLLREKQLFLMQELEKKDLDFQTGKKFTFYLLIISNTSRTLNLILLFVFFNIYNIPVTSFDVFIVTSMFIPYYLYVLLIFPCNSVLSVKMKLADKFSYYSEIKKFIIFVFSSGILLLMYLPYFKVMPNFNDMDFSSKLIVGMFVVLIIISLIIAILLNVNEKCKIFYYKMSDINNKLKEKNHS